MKDEALRLALDYITATNKSSTFWLVPQSELNKTVTAIKQALAQPEPEPVAWGVDWGKAGDSPCVSIIKHLPDGRIEVVAVEYGPKREWQGLTEGEKSEIYHNQKFVVGFYSPAKFADAIEAKLKEKNT